MHHSTVRVTGVWHYEKSAGFFGGGKMERVEKPAMLEFVFAHYPHPSAFLPAISNDSTASTSEAAFPAKKNAGNNDDDDVRVPTPTGQDEREPSPLRNQLRNAVSPAGNAASPASSAFFSPQSFQQPSSTVGQLAGDSTITLFIGDNIPPSIDPIKGGSKKGAGSVTNAAAAKFVAKQREEATKCVLRLHELVSFAVLRDKDESTDARAGVEEEGGNSMVSMHHQDSAAELSAQERVKPFTVAITFVSRTPASSNVKGTEDIFCPAEERGKDDHPLRSIKFVVTGLVASSQHQHSSSSSSTANSSSSSPITQSPITTSVAFANGQQQQQQQQQIAAAAAAAAEAAAVRTMTMRERFITRVLRPVESFLLPQGILHIFPIVSPVSGKGLGIKMYEDAKRIFQRSHHVLHPALITKYRGHAEDWVAESNDFMIPVSSRGSNSSSGSGGGGGEGETSASRSVIVAFGGDGMLHEVVNGWFKREQLVLGSSSAAFDGRPIFAPFPTGSGCAVAACLGIIEPLDTAMSVIHAHWIAHDAFVITPTGPAATPRFTKPEVVPPPAVQLKPGELPPSWDCMGWAAIKNRAPPPRIGVLSLSTGLISDVDKGSETMRYLGNARFTVEMVRMVLGSTPKYGVSLRYVPAEVATINDVSAGAATSLVVVADASKSGGGNSSSNKSQQSLNGLDQFAKFGYENSGGKYPEPAVRRACASALYKQNTSEITFASSSSSSSTASSSSAVVSDNSNAAVPKAGAAAAAEDSEEQSKKAADELRAREKDEGKEAEEDKKKWRVFTTDSKEGATYIVMVCNIPAVARDCVLCPYARCNDGALDLVAFEGSMGKVELTSALLKMEDGSHVDSGPKDKIKYAKASELHIKVSDGLLMSDGEIIPQCPSHVKCVPRCLKMVRTTKS